jgi:hypothetical protein
LLGIAELEVEDDLAVDLSLIAAEWCRRKLQDLLSPKLIPDVLPGRCSDVVGLIDHEHRATLQQPFQRGGLRCFQDIGRAGLGQRGLPIPRQPNNMLFFVELRFSTPTKAIERVLP